MGPWQYCSKTCGDDGTRRRTVICVRSLSDDEQMALHDADCPASDRPTEVDICTKMPPCPGEIAWETGSWSKVRIIRVNSSDAFAEEIKKLKITKKKNFFIM